MSDNVFGFLSLDRGVSSVEQELSEAFRAVECLRSGSSPTALLLEHSLDLGVVGREACNTGVWPD